MSNPWDIVILGCGQLGGNLKTALEAEKIHVLGVRRTPVPDDSTFIRLDLDVADAWEPGDSLVLWGSHGQRGSHGNDACGEFHYQIGS